MAIARTSNSSHNNNNAPENLILNPRPESALKETALRGTDAALVAAGVASIPEARS